MEVLHLTSTLVAEIKSHPNWILLTFFISAIISGLPVVGSVLPVSVFQLGLSSAAAKLGLNPLHVLIFLIPGLLLGDFIGFSCGHYFNTGIRHWQYLQKHQTLFERCESCFERFGGIAIIIGRVCGPLRTMTPVVSGILEMRLARFLFFDVIAALLWCVTHLGVGYLAVNPLLWSKIRALLPF